MVPFTKLNIFIVHTAYRSKVQQVILTKQYMINHYTAYRITVQMSLTKLDIYHTNNRSTVRHTWPQQGDPYNTEYF